MKYASNCGGHIKIQKIFSPSKSSALILIAMLLTCSVGYSQSAATCTLKGNVRDIQNALVPNAEITLSSRSIVRKAITTEGGEYSLTVAPGIYSVTVVPPKGFETTHRSQIKLDANSIRSLNFRVYSKVPLLWESEYAHLKGSEHPAVEYLGFSYEEIPNLSENGVRSGMVRFAQKCQTQTLTSYNGHSWSDSMSERAGITFTYDFLTVVADTLNINTKTGEIFALGDLEIENDKDYVKYDGVIKINIKDGKVTYKKIDQ